MKMSADKRLDEYIAKAADFAKPILTHLRQLVHKACPETVETIKWGFPHFEYKGGNMCSMASFKNHCAFGFWLAALMNDKHKILDVAGEKGAMGHLGQIKLLSDLPADEILTFYIHQAMQLIDAGAKLPKKPITEKIKELAIPEYFLEALQKNKKALACFDQFSYSNKKEYVEWIVDAKTEATREKRLKEAIEWMAEGKIRNWKYMKQG
jgi:uncharacterized protein YdeI (YjbR/CyaY-like superfamily)